MVPYKPSGQEGTRDTPPGDYAKKVLRVYLPRTSPERLRSILRHVHDETQPFNGEGNGADALYRVPMLLG